MRVYLATEGPAAIIGIFSSLENAAETAGRHLRAMQDRYPSFRYEGIRAHVVEWELDGASTKDGGLFEVDPSGRVLPL